MKAFILAAGKGERLKPLTNDCPKPLILIKGKPLLEWNLIKLRSAGIKEVVINLHYLGEEIFKYFGNGESFDMKIVYSDSKIIMFDVYDGCNITLLPLGDILQNTQDEDED